jgi:beta-N-acetylhexosaminidase
VRHAARAAVLLLATVVTLSCATTEPEAPGLDMRPSVPSGFAAPERPAQSGQQVTVPQPEAAPPTASETEAVASTDAGPAASQPAAAEPAETMPATTDPTMDPIEARIDELLATMTIEQKIGQRFMTWIPGTASSERAAALIEQAHVGGVIITEDNVESHQQARELIATLQRMAQAAPSAVPLFIATDQEGGRLTRVRLPELTLFPAAFHQGVHADTDYVEATAYVTGVELRRLGVNMNLAPLLDLYGEADGTVINDRSYGADSGSVSDFARAYVRGANRAGVIAVAKHFPGHGVTTTDSHDRLPVVRLTRSERSSILAPFIAAIDAGIDALMAAHILYEDLDPNLPASVSPAIVTGLLREQLAFGGVVLTDAIEIREPVPALTEPDIVRNSFEAGADIILAARARDVLPLIQEGIRLVGSGMESEERLDESVRRILRVKLQTMKMMMER